MLMTWEITYQSSHEVKLYDENVKLDSSEKFGVQLKPNLGLDKVKYYIPRSMVAPGGATQVWFG